MQNSDWRSIYNEPKKSTAVVETICLAMGGILLGYWFMPHAPFFSVQGFSWFMLGPLLSGLRYGFSYAINSVILLVAIATAAHVYNLPWAQGSTTNLFLSLLFIAIIAGEFRNYWHRRLQRLNAVACYLDERITEVSHAFNMLKHSHDRLEQLIASRTSLRDSLLSIRRQIMLSHTDNEGLSGLGLLILRSLADFGSLQGASLHAIDPVTKQINTHAIASIGNEIILNVRNSLIQKALSEHKTVSLKLDLIAQHEEELLLVIPLIDVYGKMWGLIAVNKMPFRAFREDNIQLLAVLSGYIGDLLGIKMQSKMHIGDENMLYFYVQALRCMQDVINYNIPASVLGMEFKDSQHSIQLTQLVTRLHRDLDQLLLIKNKLGNQVALFIFPLTNWQGIESYCVNFNGVIRKELNLDTAAIRFYKISLAADMNLDTEMKLLAEELNLDNNVFEKNSR